MFIGNVFHNVTASCAQDVEANTVRLKEHGKDVLVLEKMSIRRMFHENSFKSHPK